LANCQSSYWCINDVNDTGIACIAGVIDTGEDMRHLLPGINDTGEA
jgi:hypothetical protein